MTVGYVGSVITYRSLCSVRSSVVSAESFFRVQGIANPRKHKSQLYFKTSAPSGSAIFRRQVVSPLISGQEPGRPIKTTFLDHSKRKPLSGFTSKQVRLHGTTVHKKKKTGADTDACSSEKKQDDSRHKNITRYTDLQQLVTPSRIIAGLANEQELKFCGLSALLRLTERWADNQRIII